MVLTGTGGVGKTALATRFLDTIVEHFPNGTLYTDLQGFTESGPTDASDVLDAFLRALGTAPAAIPHSFEARAAAFRSRTHGKRIALLLDNAMSAAQVRALTPGQGRHLVVVTTRLHLAGLRLDGAEFLDIRPLGENEALELVTRMLGDDRAGDDPTSARRLVGLCGRLPLALRAAVSGLALRPHQPLDRLVSRLTDEGERLAVLSHTRELSVDSVFTTSYRELSEPARRLYRLLGVSPARDLTIGGAAALLAAGPPDAEDLLAHLVAANLLEEIPGGRFRQHDLIRLHARVRADEDEPAEEIEKALDRVLEYYLTTAAAADRTLNPGRWHLAPVFDRLPAHGFDSRSHALEWSENELEAIRAVVRFSGVTGRHAVCWQLCEALRNLFMVRKHFDVWEETHAHGLEAATASGDPAAQANMLNALAGLRLTRGEPERAAELHDRALELWERAEHTLGQASSLEGRGVCELAVDRPRHARRYFERALDIHTRLGRDRGIALMLRRLGEADRDLGEHSTAIDHFHRALQYFDPVAEPYMRTRTLVGLAATHLATADTETAFTVLTEVLDISERIGAGAEKARAQVMSADIAESQGHLDRARTLLKRALSTYTELDSPEAEPTRRRLGSPPYTSRP